MPDLGTSPFTREQQEYLISIFKMLVPADDAPVLTAAEEACIREIVAEMIGQWSAGSSRRLTEFAKIALSGEGYAVGWSRVDGQNAPEDGAATSNATDEQIRLACLEMAHAQAVGEGPAVALELAAVFYTYVKSGRGPRPACPQKDFVGSGKE